MLDLSTMAKGTPYAEMLSAPVLNPFMAAGPRVWAEVHQRIEDGPRIPLAGVTMHLPFEVADYVDFYSSRHHAENAGRIFRPGAEPLPPSWLYLPIGYHGRAGTVVVSGTDIPRPHGQLGKSAFGPTHKLDFEAEVGFVVGVPSDGPVPVDAFADHVFGVCLVNDWSARDIQAWEYVPLGPFLGKSFATSISPWIVPLAALEQARVEPPPQDPEPLPYLRGGHGYDITLEVRLNGHLISRPPYAGMYWTPAQQLAHLTVSGASLRTGDLYASGTVSGPRPDQRGSLLELSWGGRDKLALPDGTVRTFLEDGDEVVITATAPGVLDSLGEVRGRIKPTRSGH